MKKFALIALALTLGVTCAFAATLKVPWFVDNAAAGAGVPPTGGGDNFPLTLGLVYLSNTTDNTLNCTIGYYSANGTSIGPFTNNTFSIDPNATVAFRPVASDAVGTSNQLGQESAKGAAIPDRPRDVFNAGQIAADPSINQKNGSIKITYTGNAADLGGQITLFTQGGSRPTAFAAAHSLIPLFGTI